MIPIRKIAPEKLGEDEIARSFLIWQYYRDIEAFNDPMTRNHEDIHWYQVVKGWLIVWAIVKGLCWAINKCQNNDAYWNDPYEKEAYANEKNIGYMPTMFSWTNYI